MFIETKIMSLYFWIKKAAEAYGRKRKLPRRFCLRTWGN
jgi:hypothetical protein